MTIEFKIITTDSRMMLIDADTRTKAEEIARKDGHTLKEKIRIKYKNWKGNSRFREIVPIELWYGSTKWHPYSQYFIKALDLEDNAIKDFALLGFNL